MLETTTKGEQHTMSKIGKSRCAIAVGAVALALGAAQVNAAELTVVNFGGANGTRKRQRSTSRSNRRPAAR